ncbi:MAG: ABC transporter substrate-binding protein [Thermomicrobiales bacterium]
MPPIVELQSGEDCVEQRHSMKGMIGRRTLLRGVAVTGAGIAAGMPAGMLMAQGAAPPDASPAASPTVSRLPDLAIDLDRGPDNLDPALAYSSRDWSIVHAIYDSLLHFAADGEIVPLAAESFTSDDAKTFHVVLREGLTYHDGTPVKAEAIARSVTHIQESDSQIAALFQGIESVEVVDDRTAILHCTEPSAWLPSQIAVWLVLYPEGMDERTWWTAPVGTGPYRFASYEAGSQVTLERNKAYTWGSPKGEPLADRVTYRFVPEAATRIADLSTGAARIVTSVPLDQRDAISDAGAEPVIEPILGTSFLRIATDAKPFDDPRVCQALNYAIDVETIAATLVAPESHRLAALYPDPRGLGFDPDLAPFAYDPDKARALLSEAGLADGFATTLQFAATEKADALEAIASYLGDVGIHVTLEAVELAAFNQAWPDTSAPPIRYASWRPLYDPHSLLSLMYLSTGYLSRYNNPAVDKLILAAAAEPNVQARTDLYRQLGREMQVSPGAVYLWNIVSGYGVAPDALAWSPRGDDYTIAMANAR